MSVELEEYQNKRRAMKQREEAAKVELSERLAVVESMRAKAEEAVALVAQLEKKVEELYRAEINVISRERLTARRSQFPDHYREEASDGPTRNDA